MPLFVPLSEVAAKHKAWATSAHARVPLGFREVIDGRTNGGPAPGEVVLIVARSGVGKTILGCNIAVNAVRQGIHTVFFSLEMNGGRILQRLTAINFDVPTSSIEGDLQAGQSALLDTFVDKYSHLLTVIDEPSLRLGDMSQAIAEAEEAFDARPRLVIIDYFELVTGGAAMSMNESIERLSRKLKDWTRREDVVTVVLHQLNMGGDKHEDKGDRPVVKRDIKFGVDVAADYVLGAFRPGMYSDSETKDFRLQLLKTRTDGGLELQGIEHHLNPHSLKLYPPSDHSYLLAEPAMF